MRHELRTTKARGGGHTLNPNRPMPPSKITSGPFDPIPSSNPELAEQNYRNNYLNRPRWKDGPVERAKDSVGSMILRTTNNGLDIVEAVDYVFRQARLQDKHELLLEAATWLSDRAFGKPVQMTALVDAENTPGGYIIWQPALGDNALPPLRIAEPRDARIIDMEPTEVAVSSSAPSDEPDAPADPVEVQPKPIDGYAEGLAKDWTGFDKEPRLGE